MAETIEKKSTKVNIDPQILHETQEEGQVIIHCTFYNDQTVFFGDVGIRIWKSTYLIDETTHQKSKLLNAYNVPLAPHWYFIKPYDKKSFTLVFDALPKDCLFFTFTEIIPEPGAFVVKNIPRNKADVYHIKLS